MMKARKESKKMSNITWLELFLHKNIMIEFHEKALHMASLCGTNASYQSPVSNLFSNATYIQLNWGNDFFAPSTVKFIV